MDLVVETDRYPEEGETIIGGKFEQIPGGKGANQALAAAKLGGDVEFIGAAGDDSFAPKLIESLKKGGVITENVFTAEGVSTGVAVITVEKNGENRIIVSPGANHELDSQKINSIKEKIKEAEVLLLQLEIPMETIEEIVKIAAEGETKIILDPAPAAELSKEVLAEIDYLLPNEGELELLLKDQKLKSREEKIKYLIESGVKNILVTEGEKGVNFYNSEVQIHQDAFIVNAVDTTAAGDVFAGAFAAELIKESELEKILKYASAAAACSVTKLGAQSSMPDLEELNNFLKERSGRNEKEGNIK